MSVVLHASMTIAWVFEDERTDAADRVLGRIGDEGADVPALWALEVANGLRVAVRRGRCDEAFVDRALAQFGALSIRLDEETHSRAWRETVALARRDNLTVYDAVYLELALRLEASLATADRRLASAAKRRGLPVLIP